MLVHGQIKSVSPPLTYKSHLKNLSITFAVIYHFTQTKFAIDQKIQDQTLSLALLLAVPYDRCLGLYLEATHLWRLTIV